METTIAIAYEEALSMDIVNEVYSLWIRRTNIKKSMIKKISLQWENGDVKLVVPKDVFEILIN